MVFCKTPLDSQVLGHGSEGLGFALLVTWCPPQADCLSGPSRCHSPPSPLAVIILTLQRFRANRDWLTKHSKAGESWLSLGHPRKPSAKSEGIQRDFPASPAFPPLPETRLCSPDACNMARSRLSQQANGMDSGSDKGQRMKHEEKLLCLQASDPFDETDV